MSTGRLWGCLPGWTVSLTPLDPVDVFRSLLDPLRQTWRSGMHRAPGPDELCRLSLRLDPGSSWIGVRATEPAGGGEGARDGWEGGGDKFQKRFRFKWRSDQMLVIVTCWFL